MAVTSSTSDSVEHSADLVIIGGGMAAERLLCQLEALDFSGSVLLVSDELEAGYNRVLLPDLLSGRSSWSDMAGRSRQGVRGDWYERQLGLRIIELDIAKQSARGAKGGRIRWGTLVLATGSSTAIPAALQVESTGIQVLRSLADVREIEESQRAGQTVAVIGGGLLGLEAAHALHQLGWRVVVVHRSARLMNRQLDDEAAELLLGVLTSHGLEFRMGLEVAAVETTQNGVMSLGLSDGTLLAVDRVVVATGNSANIALAQAAGLRCQTGVVVDDRLQSSADSIYAIGECAEFSGETHCFVEPVYAQADALARHLCGQPARLVLPPASTRLKVAGVELFCAGRTGAEATDADSTSTVVRDTRTGIYRCLRFHAEELSGAILLGDTHGSRSIFEALHTPITSTLKREQLLFGTSSSHA